MRRVCVISSVFLFLAVFFLGCSRHAAKKDDAKEPVAIDPGQIQLAPPIDKKIEPPKKIVKSDGKLEKYEAALADGLSALAERKWNDAYEAFEKARKFQDTEFVRAEIARLKGRVDQDQSAKNTVKNIETVLADGNADDAAKLAGDALKEFGAGDDADKLVELRLQAEAIRNAEKKEGGEARFNRFKKEGDLAVGEKNLRAAALAYEQALEAQPDAELKQTAEGIRAKVDEYDALRKKGIELRRDGLQLDEALAAFKGAAAAWDTLQIRADIDDCQLALAKRRDVIAVADFELRNDVGMAGAGGAIADELSPLLKPKYDTIERAQLQVLLGQLGAKPGLHDDPKQQRQIGNFIKARYLVVGSVQRLVGVSIRARLVDVQTGLVVQTGKIVAIDMDDALKQIPDLAKQLLMTDDAKAQLEQDKAAQPVAPAPDNAAIQPAPAMAAADAPPPPPAAMINPAPPVFGAAKAAAFKNFAAQPDVMAAPPIDPWQGPMRNRLLFATLERGDFLFQAGRFADAQRLFQVAAMLAPDNADVQARLNNCAPYVPPLPFGYAPKQRIAIMPFMVVGNPFVVPPYLASWTPQNLAPYFGWRYDVADPTEVYWFMGRMGLTMNDLLLDPNARRWLGRAVGVRYFVFGNCMQTTSFDVNTYMIDAEHNYQQGSANINVNDTNELALRLPELAQLTMMSPAEQAAYQQARLQQLIYAGQVHFVGGFFRQAAIEFQKALQIDPYNVQVQVLLQVALTQANFQDFANAQQLANQAQQAMWLAQLQRQQALMQAANLMRQQALRNAIAYSDAERQQRLQNRLAAQAALGKQAQAASAAGNFRLSVSLYQGAAQVAPTQAINFQGLAQARLGADRAEQGRIAQFSAARENTLRPARDKQLQQAKQALATEQAASQKQLAASVAAQSKQDDLAYQAGIAQGVKYVQQSKYDAALAAFQGAQRIKQTEQVSNLIDDATRRQAVSLAKTLGEKAAVEKKLQAEHDRRKVAASQAKQNDDNYKTALSAAQTALAAKNYDTAQAKFQEAGKVFKTDAVLTGMQQVDAARAALLADSQKADADKKRANLVQQYLATGKAALDGKRYLDAMQSFQQAKKLAPDNLDAIAGLSQAEVGQQRLAQGTKDTGKEKTIPPDPTDANNLKQKLADYQTALGVGQKALTGKDYKTAIASAQQALKLMPDDAAASKLLQQAQQAQAGADKAAAHFQSAVDTGRKAMTARDYKGAVKAFTEATTLNPTDATARMLLAQAQQALQDANAQALKTASYQKAMTAGQTALQFKRYKDAVTAFNDALKVMPNDQKATQQLAQAQQLLQDSSKIKTLPDPPKQDYEGAMKRGAAAETDLKYPDALKAYQEALKARPKDQLAQVRANFAQYVVNGQQYIDNMMWLDAARELEGALRLQPKNAYALKLYQKAKNKGK